ncbi:MAG: YggS family pyridoxal phosphate-dependent enzyme [Ignavibacteriaceae bacterium]|nr:YggS family pyridoxal phosphate-dependent enzyme [Ignavibacteriaceae bacterium]
MIAENIKSLHDRIAERCIKVNRNPAEIKIIAVSKNFGVDEILKANKEGIYDFGENKAQDFDSKFVQLGNKVTWHFIGHLQRNKVRFVAGCANYIHSVDSLQIAMEINKRAERLDKVQKILLQIKTSAEETKSGITDEAEIMDIVSQCSEFRNIELSGLMTIAPLTEDKKLIRNSFNNLSKLKDKLTSKGIDIKELSMGMTDDFEIAIEEGATMLRIGTAIFGERDY